MPASRSTGTPGPSGPPQRLRLPKLPPAELARALGTFIIALALWFATRELLTDSIVTQGRKILAKLADHPQPSELIRKLDGRYSVDTGLPGPDDETHRLEMRDLHTFSWTTTYAIWLVLLTPLRRLRQHWWLVLAAFGALWLMQLAFFTTNVTTRMGSFFLSQGFDFLFGPQTQRTLDTLCRAYQLTLNHVVPFILYAPVLLLPLHEAPAEHSPKAPRNDPCPCGSGRKFKRCCGTVTRH